MKKKLKRPLTCAERAKRWRENNPDKVRVACQRSRELHQERKRRVLTHYGNGECACVKCGFNDIRALSIDHIDKDSGPRIRSSSRFYKWLEDNDYPKGFQTLCMNCQFIKRDEDMELFSKFTRIKNRTDKELLETLLQIEKSRAK